MKYTDEIGQFLLKHGPDPEVVAIGEIGLDYYYDQSPRAEQIDAFEKQLEIAAQLNLPVEIHNARCRGRYGTDFKSHEGTSSRADSLFYWNGVVG